MDAVSGDLITNLRHISKWLGFIPWKTWFIPWKAWLPVHELAGSTLHSSTLLPQSHILLSI